MTAPSQSRKKKRITYTASQEGVERAEKALKRLGFESKTNFAKSQLLARSTVTKFFLCQPIQLDSFKRICKALELKWEVIAGIIEEKKPEPSGSDTITRVEPVQTTPNQVTVREQVTVTVINTDSQTTIAVLILEGELNSVNTDLAVSLELLLRKSSGQTIKITRIQEGSIRLIVEGSQEDIKRLVSRIRSGELTKLSSFPIEDVQILGESSDDDEGDELDDKWRLVQEIVTQLVKGRNLGGADLSDADLSGADLSDADLSGADLSDADLSGADLSGADLSGADLRRVPLREVKINEATKIDRKWLLVWKIVNQGTVGLDLRGADLMDANLSRAKLSRAKLSRANLSGADLRGANLRGANLSGVNLSGADLSGANLSGANLSGVNLSGADLSGADLSGADLSGADLSGAKLSGVNLSGVNLSGVNLSGAKLSRADLRGADLSGADEGREHE